jgi:hypothetical protein
VNIALAPDFDNTFDDTGRRTRFDVAQLLGAAGYHATARSVRHCGEEHLCKSRHCPTCKPKWKRERCKRLLDAIEGTGADDVVCMVTSTVCDIAAEATEHFESWALFVRGAHFPVHGAFHLVRRKVGRRQWVAHHHIFVSKRLVPDVMAAWAKVATRPAKMKPIRTTLEQAVAYAVKGAVKIPPNTTDAIDWLRALRGPAPAKRGRRLVTIRKGRALKEETQTHYSTPHGPKSEASIRKRIIRYVRKYPSGARLRKMFALHERSTFEGVLIQLRREGLVTRHPARAGGFRFLPGGFFDDF